MTGATTPEVDIDLNKIKQNHQKRLATAKRNIFNTLKVLQNFRSAFGKGFVSISVDRKLETILKKIEDIEKEFR